MPRVAVLGVIFGITILAVVLFLSMDFTTRTCEVCTKFNGRTQCRKASGADEETAIRAAHDNACAFLIASKTDGFLCAQTCPKRISCQ